MMKTFTTSEARQQIAAAMDAAQAGEPVKITRRDGSANVLISESEFNAYREMAMDAEFDLIMQRHGRTVKALSDR